MSFHVNAVPEFVTEKNVQVTTAARVLQVSQQGGL